MITGHDIAYTCMVIDTFFHHATKCQKLKLQEYIDNKLNPAKIAEIEDKGGSLNQGIRG